MKGLDNKITSVLNGLSSLRTTEKVTVSKEQLNVLESLVVAYMSIVDMDIEQKERIKLLSVADGLWDTIFDVN